jgi:hypothetical protein
MPVRRLYSPLGIYELGLLPLTLTTPNRWPHLPLKQRPLLQVPSPVLAVPLYIKTKSRNRLLQVASPALAVPLYIKTKSRNRLLRVARAEAAVVVVVAVKLITIRTRAAIAGERSKLNVFW